MKKQLILHKETRVAQDDKGQTFQYDVYYVDVNGIKVELKANDRTAKLLINQYLESDSAN
jgi:hypothetical protein